MLRLDKLPDGIVTSYLFSAVSKSISKTEEGIILCQSCYRSLVSSLHRRQLYFSSLKIYIGRVQCAENKGAGE